MGSLYLICYFDGWSASYIIALCSLYIFDVTHSSAANQRYQPMLVDDLAGNKFTEPLNTSKYCALFWV